MSETDWKVIATALAQVVRIAGCRCEYERGKNGVPLWFPSPDGNGIERKLIKRCSRCVALEAYESAAAAT